MLIRVICVSPCYIYTAARTSDGPIINIRRHTERNMERRRMCDRILRDNEACVIDGKLTLRTASGSVESSILHVFHDFITDTDLTYIRVRLE